MCTKHHIIILLHKVTFLVNMPLTLLLKDSYEHFFLFRKQLNAIIHRGSCFIGFIKRVAKKR